MPRRRKTPQTGDELVHAVIRDQMIENGLSRHELARSFIRGAHDLEMTSRMGEKKVAAIYMREQADHLMTGLGWLLFKGELEVPFPIEPAERARRSIATDRGTCETVAMDLALQLMRLGWPPNKILDGLLAASRRLTSMGNYKAAFDGEVMRDEQERRSSQIWQP